MPLPYSCPNEMQLPHWLLVDLRESYKVLDTLAANDRLPTIDVEAVMSSIPPILDAHSPGRFTTDEFYRELDLITEDVFRVAEPNEFEFNYAFVRKRLLQAILRADLQLQLGKIYVRGHLPYNYVQRKQSGRALLVLSQDGEHSPRLTNTAGPTGF